MLEFEYQLKFLALPAAIYVSLVFYGKHLPQRSIDAVSNWLKGQSDETWINLYVKALDQGFGSEFWSIKRLTRLSAASVTSVIVLWFVFGELSSISPNRVAEPPHIKLAVALAVALNIIPNILSFQQTRILLGIFAHRKNPFLQVAVLLADLVVSSLIILCALTAWRFASGKGALLPLEIIGGFTSYSIFFYSSFLTSIWAWLFVLSLWIMRLGAKLWDYRLLDVARKPIDSLALLAATLVLLFSVIAPRAEPFAVKIEELLCDNLLPHCGVIYETRAVNALRDLCEGSNAIECYQSITQYFTRMDRPELGDRLILNGCEQGKVGYCAVAMLVPGQSMDQRIIFAKAGFSECSESDATCEVSRSLADILNYSSKFTNNIWPARSVFCPFDISWGESIYSLPQITASFLDAEIILAAAARNMDSRLNSLERENAALQLINIRFTLENQSLLEAFDSRPHVNLKLIDEIKLRTENVRARTENARARTENARARTENARAQTDILISLNDINKVRNKISECTIETNSRDAMFGTILGSQK